MRTVKQVSSLTGVSVRTLQFYDEIGLFKPTEVTDAGYRLYDDASLEILQQILFFKELDFTLKEIKEIMDNSKFDKSEAFKKQRVFIEMKRDRLNGLLILLEKLEKGEHVMSFEKFDMDDYFKALDEFKKAYINEIVNKYGCTETFDEMVNELKSNESQLSQHAIKQYGSLEKFTEVSKKNLEKFLQINAEAVDVEESIKKTDYLTRKLTEDLCKDVYSEEIQKKVGKLIDWCDESNNGLNLGENYWPLMVDNYLTNPIFINVNDKKYGEGASAFIGKAVKAYFS
ncbi:MerR family transcriptional regulator [Anaerotignum propionicum]|uniref:MerR family transcriptional regulator n=1 Tax=Anaerotignum propionicum TaxID=28446 RepID=UPI00210866E2|nr:MerR family transcriptional regulator [Anaerotignum propionicum]MCQ4936278.1 MerR family transcriptional regulator [Anaerotignum propionicum]